MIAYAEEIGQKISKKWDLSGNNPDELPDIIEAMIDIDEFNYNSLDLYQTVSDSKLINIQIPTIFSEYHCRLYSDDNIFIDILHWNKLDTDLHSHNFTGVLFQLEGESLDVCYNFDINQVVLEDRFEIGNMSIKSIDVLKGSKRKLQKIYSGNAHNHAVLHIEKPTISLIIRTHPISSINQNMFFPKSIRIQYNSTFQDVKFIRLLKYTNSISEKKACVLLKQYIEEISSYPDRTMSLLAKTIDIIISSKIMRSMLQETLNENGDSVQQEIYRSVNAFSIYRKNALLKNELKKKSDIIDKACFALSYGDQGFYDKLITAYHQST